MTDLYRHLALRDDYPAGVCWAWVESRGTHCGKPEGGAPHLCTRHETVALRRAEAATFVKRWEERGREASVDKLPARREALANVDRQIRRLDPPPPTTDMAAFAGEGSTAGDRYRARHTDDRIAKLAALTRKRTILAAAIERGERIERGEA